MSSKKSSKKRAPPTCTNAAKSARKEIEIHPSQEALAQRFVETAEKVPTGLIIDNPPGLGKTRTLRCALDKMEQVGGPHTVDLVVYVAKTPALARSQAVEVGSHYKVPMNMSHVKGLANALRQKNSTDSIRVCTTHTMFKSLFSKYNFVDNFMTPLGSPCMHIVLDEVHRFYTKRSSLSTAMAAVRKYVCKMRVTGLTATPQLDDHEGKAESVLGGKPQVIKYTDDEAELFRKDLMSHCPTSNAKWKTEKLNLSPAKDERVAEYMGPLSTIVVGNVKNQGDVSINAWNARNSQIAKIIATQVHGDDNTGGELFKKLSTKPVWKRVEEDGSNSDKKRPHSALVVHRHPAGGELHHEMLKSLVDEEGVQPFTVHDLRATDLATFHETLERFTKDVTTTDGMVLAIVDKRQIEGTNDYAKNVSAIVAVGEWTSAELTQLGGRLGRPCVLHEGDLVPEAFTLIHFESKKNWASEVSKLGLVRQSIRAGADKVPEEFKARFAALDDDEKKKALELIDGSKLLGTDLLALFLDSMEPESTFETEYDNLVRNCGAVDFENEDD